MKTVSAPRPDARGASTFDRWRSRHGDGTIGPARLALRLIVEAAFENLGSDSRNEPASLRSVGNRFPVGAWTRRHRNRSSR